jgi:serine/threonine protein kinase
MEKSNFLKEIEMMKSVSKVENELSCFVVNMLGCVVTKEPMILVLEYMECGNLLDYLRVTRSKVNL